MKNSEKNQSSSNLIDLTQDFLNGNTYESLISSERNNNISSINDTNIKKAKKVKFSEKVVYIDVECWKKYNVELTADENFDDINEEEINDNQKKDDNKNNNNNKIIKRKENIVCTCNVI